MRLASLLFCIVLLSACDSGTAGGGGNGGDGDDDDSGMVDQLPAELVGTWGALAINQDTYVTSPTAQTYTRRGQTSDVTGSVQIDGVVTPFEFARLLPINATPFAVFTNYDPSRSAPTDVRTVVLSVQNSGSGSRVSLRVREADGEQYAYSLYDPAQPVQTGDPTIAVGTFDFIPSSDTEPAVAQASATSPTTALPPGVRTRVANDRGEYDLGETGRPFLRYTFAADGSARYEIDHGASMTVREGTWQVRDEMLSIEYTDPSTEAESFEYALDDGDLSLTTLQFRCSEASCLDVKARFAELSGPLSLY